MGSFSLVSGLAFIGARRKKWPGVKGSNSVWFSVKSDIDRKLSTASILISIVANFSNVYAINLYICGKFIKAAKKASVERSKHAFRCTALVEKQTKIAGYPLTALALNKRFYVQRARKINSCISKRQRKIWSFCRKFRHQMMLFFMLVYSTHFTISDTFRH